ncbi:MAG: aminomethyl transferase family protein, partial [Pseudomonadota bacterium]|nr:aminomethyl transferase family protein [Pseudomonadota bacterium]
MHEDILNRRYVIKGIVQPTGRGVELAHPENCKPHPLSYLELPFDPEYSLYNKRMTPEYLNNITADQQYWAVRQKVILRNTGEFPVEISGPQTEEFANYIFTRDIKKFKTGRCSYQLACLHDGGLITDGVMLHFNDKKLWMVQADGDLLSWYKAHANSFEVTIRDPNVWVSQVQGPRSMDLLAALIDGPFPEPWNYFDMAEVTMSGEPLIITRTGFSNELGWEFYLRPENSAEKIGEKIMDIGKKFEISLTGTPVFRARRIEAGLLSAGVDFDNSTTPFDAGLENFVDMEKENFIGKKALIKARKQKIIWGLKVKGGIARKGLVLGKNGENIGNVTSCTWSPYLKCGVGIIRVKNIHF